MAVFDRLKSKFKSHYKGTIRFCGNYKSWNEARKASVGYDSDIILMKIKNSLMKVKLGAAIYERDPVSFDRIEYSWPLLADLMWTAARYKGYLNVLDFGGSLGTSYYQNRFFLANLPYVRWNVVEQEKFVECGKKHFEDGILHFYSRIDDCLSKNQINVAVLSSVIQYVEDPYATIKQIVCREISTLIIDRTPFIKEGDDILTIQYVPENIYPASYPCWFLNEYKFLSIFEDRYTLIAAEILPVDYSKLWKSKQKAQEKFLIFKLKNDQYVE